MRKSILAVELEQATELPGVIDAQSELGSSYFHQSGSGSFVAAGSRGVNLAANRGGRTAAPFQTLSAPAEAVTNSTLPELINLRLQSLK